jgi:tRNA modification GTPase
LTVEGPAALATIGPLVRLRSGKSLASAASGRPVAAHFDLGTAAPEEVVVHRRSDQAVEIHCHGGPAVVEAIVEALAAQGCRSVDWRQWLDENGTDPLQAAAHVALASAKTLRTAAILLDQYDGALRGAVNGLTELLDRGRYQEAQEQLAGLLKWAPLGLHLTRPWKVVLVGRPNVGKSSLINALAGYGRSIVYQTPGTTRDVVRTTIAIDGVPLEIADTAGLRWVAEDPLEQAGVERTLAELAGADLIVLVVDRSRPPSDEEDALLDRHAEALVAVNKCDLPPGRPPQPAAMEASARTGEGIETLGQAVVSRLVPRWPAAGTAAPFTRGHVGAFEEAERLLAAGRPEAARAILQGL